METDFKEISTGWDSNLFYKVKLNRYKYKVILSCLKKNNLPLTSQQYMKRIPRGMSWEADVVKCCLIVVLK